MNRNFYRMYVDKGNGWVGYGSCLTEKMVKVLKDRFLARGWAVKVERV